MEDSDVREEVRTFLDDHPNARDALATLLDVDERRDGWEFDDVAIDSGTFGEIVSRGIVEKDEGSYRLADRAAVARAVDDRSVPSEGASKSLALDDIVDQTVRRLEATVGGLRGSYRTVTLLAFALVAIVVVRSAFVHGTVFRDGIVLPGNDPYRYRYWLHELATGSLDPFTIDGLRNLPGRVPTDDVLLVAVLWWIAAIFGNTPGVVDVVLAWYPVVTAAATGVLAYLAAVRLTDDPRIGIAAALFLAVTPIHATYTALGFADHHAFDYLLLAVMMLSLVASTDRRPDGEGWRGAHTRSAWRWAAVLGIAIAAQNAAWRGGPILILGVGAYASVRVLADVRAGSSPAVGAAPAVAALALAASLTAVLHYGLGWLQPYRLVAPAALLCGVLAVVGAGELARRLELSARQTAVGVVGATGIATAALWLTVPVVGDAASRFLAYLGRTGGSNITETASLFAIDSGIIFGALFYLGFHALFAVPAMAWGLWVGYRDDRPEWLAASAVGWYLLALAAVQVRFAGELAVPLVVFAGVGFVAFLSKVDLVRPVDAFGGEGVVANGGEDGGGDPAIGIPSPGKAAYLGLAVLLLVGYGPVATAGYVDDVAVHDDGFETASWIGEYAEERGLADEDRYVFSDWGKNRFYNYHAGADYQSYSYAQTNYDSFLGSSETDRWYERLAADGRAGFVVTEPLDQELSAGTNYATLHERYGSAGDGAPGAEHFRTVYVSDEDRAVHEAVPGARLTGSGPADETLTVAADVEIEGETVTYEREVETNRYGDWGVTVPYADEYSVDGETRSVSELEVTEGRVSGSYLAHWTFDEGEGSTTRDPVGGSTGDIYGAEWTEGPNGSSALEFDRSEEEYVDLGREGANLSGAEEFTVCSEVKIEGTKGQQDIVHLGNYQVLLSWNGNYDQLIAYFHNGTEAHRVAVDGSELTGEWQTICAQYDGSRLMLQIDSQQVGVTTASGTVRATDGPHTVGSSGTNDRFFDGEVADVQVYDRNANGV